MTSHGTGSKPSTPPSIRQVKSIHEDYDYDPQADRIGSGAFSFVYRATHKATSQLVAIKVVRKDRLESEKSIKELFREVRVLGSLQHRRCVKLFDAAQTRGEFYIVMQLVRGVELAKLLRKTGALAEEVAAAIIRQLLEATVYLHGELKCIHRDLKLDNILVTLDFNNDEHNSNNEAPLSVDDIPGPVLGTLARRGWENTSGSDVRLSVTLVDFGFARVVAMPGSRNSRTPQNKDGGDKQLKSTEELDSGENKPSKVEENKAGVSNDTDSSDDSVPLSACGAERFLPPEILRPMAEGTQIRVLEPTKIDIFSIGVVTYLLLSGCFPFNGKCASTLASQISSLGPKFNSPHWQSASGDAKDFIGALLRASPSDRPTAAQALQHRWIQRSVASEDSANDASALMKASHSSSSLFA